MVYFKIEEPNKEVKYITSVDGANGTLTFQPTKDKNAYMKDEGFFADSKYEFLKFHFKEKYPELKYLKLESSWDPHYQTPNDPHEEEEGQADGINLEAPIYAA